MFTANVAGAAGSHLRSDIPHRDSHYHSRHNLHDIDREPMGNEHLRLHHVHVGDRHIPAQDPESLSFMSHPVQWLTQNYQSCIYLSCLFSIIIGAIVIIILAVIGVIRPK